MTMELEEAFPSFSTERIRSKILIRDAPATQRRLDYNAPLLSVRRLKDGGGGARSKVWKLSAELSKESLTVPGAVPFTWEHSPGRPKETEALTGEVASVSRAPKSPPAPSSPPRLPSSPSPPSTPSPPSARRASPASPPLLSPPPLRPRFIRSHSSTLFAPPPPPPPPPPPVPSMHSPFRVTQRSPPPTPTDYPLPSSSLRIPPHPPPPPPATHTSTAHDRGKAFRLFDPTEDLLRALRARREKLEASEVQSEATGLFTGTFKTDASSAEPKDDTNTTSCDVVDGIVRRFRADHPDASTEKEAFGDGLDSETQHGDDKGMSGAVNCNNGGVASISSIEDDDAARHCKTFHLDARNDDIALQENVPALRVCSDEDAEEMGMQKPNLLNRALSGTFEGDKLEPVAVCVSQQPFTVAVEVQSETGHKQVSLTKKQQQNKCRRSNSVAILDSCRVETLRMLKSVLVQLCRKAATASQQTLGKAKRMITGHCSSVEVVQHRNSSAALNGSSSNLLEKAVVREFEVTPRESHSQSDQMLEASFQDRIPQLDQVWEVQMHPVSPLKLSAEMQAEAMELHKGTPLSSPDVQGMETPDTTSSQPPPSPPRRARNFFLKEAMETIIPCPSNQNLTRQDNPRSQPAAHDQSRELRPFSVRHVYAKSLGGDETSEFFDALSRFASQSSTPSRIFSGGSMSRDWGPSDDFLDATSTPFESPRTSVSEFWYSGSPAIASKSGSSNRPTSKLSKRVGKTLWVDTGEVHATGKSSDLRSAPIKTFYSGELFATTSTASSSALNKEEPLSTRRKWVSGDQASSSQQARRQNKRNISCPQIGKNSIAVTPVFHSKCQKNRMIASASGLPCPMLAEDMKDVGWPLGISGYPPPSKKCGKEKAESKHEVGCSSSGSSVVPLPPLPAAPAGGSWLRKALTSNTLNQAPSRLAGLQAPVEKTTSSPSANSPNNKWEDIVKGSHVQPGHLRFSEELHHQPPKASSNKYFVS